MNLQLSNESSLRENRLNYDFQFDRPNNRRLPLTPKQKALLPYGSRAFIRQAAPAGTPTVKFFIWKNLTGVLQAERGEIQTSVSTSKNGEIEDFSRKTKR